LFLFVIAGGGKNAEDSKKASPLRRVKSNNPANVSFTAHIGRSVRNNIDNALFSRTKNLGETPQNAPNTHTGGEPKRRYEGDSGDINGFTNPGDDPESLRTRIHRHRQRKTHQHQQRSPLSQEEHRLGEHLHETKPSLDEGNRDEESADISIEVAENEDKTTTGFGEASKDDGRSGEIHDSGSDATEDDSGSSKAQDDSSGSSKAQDESSGDEAAEGRRQDNEITAEDLESVKGKSHAKPQVHVKLEASKKEKPGDLVEELQKEGAKIKKKDKAKSVAFPWWAFLLIVLLIVGILCAIVAIALISRRRRRSEEPGDRNKHSTKKGGTTMLIRRQRDPREFKCLSAGYIDEIASMKEDEEETENKLKGTQSTHFPTLKEAKKMAKMARKSKATLKDVMDWN